MVCRVWPQHTIGQKPVETARKSRRMLEPDVLGMGIAGFFVTTCSPEGAGGPHFRHGARGMGGFFKKRNSLGVSLLLP